MPAAAAAAERAEDVERYQGIKQYSLARILAVWAAAALPMGILAWIVAPGIKDSLSGEGAVPMFKALLILLTAGLFWQCVLVVGLVWHEQHTLRWSVVRNVLWLRSPRSPRTGRVGGRLWLMVIPLTLLFALGGFVPTFSIPKDRDLATWIGTESGKHFMQGNWGWFAAILLLFLFNILGEELLFRGVLLPRMKGVFGRRDWVANAILFTVYHLHEPWLMPGTFVCDTFAYVPVQALPEYVDRDHRPRRTGSVLRSTAPRAGSPLNEVTFLGPLAQSRSCIETRDAGSDPWSASRGSRPDRSKKPIRDDNFERGPSSSAWGTGGTTPTDRYTGRRVLAGAGGYCLGLPSTGTHACPIGARWWSPPQASRHADLGHVSGSPQGLGGRARGRRSCSRTVTAIRRSKTAGTSPQPTRPRTAGFPSTSGFGLGSRSTYCRKECQQVDNAD